MADPPLTSSPASSAHGSSAHGSSADGPRAEVVVDLDAVRHNVGVLRAAAPHSQLMAVVKADGYAHGAVAVGRAALAAGAQWLGVCTLDEALELRAAGITAPILSWLHLPSEDFAPAIEAGIDLSVSSPEHLHAVLAGARTSGGVARLHLKADTGLSRGGAQPARWAQLLDIAEKGVLDGDAEVVAVWSHLSHGDDPRHPVLDRQAERLAVAWQAARERGFDPIRHLANSGGTLSGRPELQLDLVRPGCAVYGLDPYDRPVPESPLRPAMTLRARVALVKDVPPGEGVSYGHEWVTPATTRLALLPVGYADGVSRALNRDGRMRVLIGGELRPVVGRVSMDQIVVDCGPGSGPVAVAEGDHAVLFGPGDGGEPTAQDWADELGTIHYEVVTGMRGSRAARTTVGGGDGSW